MPHSLARQPLPAALRRWLVGAWADPESRSTVVGVGGVVLFYLLLWLVALLLPPPDPVLPGAKTHAAPRQFNIELAPDAFVPKAPAKTPPPFKFVETNPDAPANKPDKTANFGAQDQQLAQEKPAEIISDRPTTEGKKDRPSTQIVTGNHQKPVEVAEVAPPVENLPAKIAVPKLEQSPLAGVENKEGDNPDGFGTHLAKPTPNATPVAQKIEGMRDVPLLAGADATTPPIDPLKPQPRKMLNKSSASNSRPAIFEEHPAGAPNIGIRAHNALKTTYGAYLQRLIDSVDLRWNDRLNETHTYPPAPSHVDVTFRLNADGKVSAMVNVDGDAGDLGKGACVYAISPRAEFSYGKWTEDMIALIGESTEITFTFYYQ